MTSTHPDPFCVASFPGLLSLSGGSPPKIFEFLSPIQRLIVCWRQRGAALGRGVLRYTKQHLAALLSSLFLVRREDCRIRENLGWL